MDFWHFSEANYRCVTCDVNVCRTGLQLCSIHTTTALPFSMATEEQARNIGSVRDLIRRFHHEPAQGVTVTEVRIDAYNVSVA